MRFLLTACTLLTLSSMANAAYDNQHQDTESTGKKGYGLAESSGQGSDVLDLLKVHWYYNWGANTKVKNSAIFVPMVFSLKHSDDIKENIPVVLGFNEPDNEKQSNLSVQDALKAWPALAAHAQSIGAPSTAKNPLKPGNWLPDFMSKQPKVDFITVHWYKGVSAKKFVEDIQSICNTYDLPVWVTEFAPQTAGDARKNPQRFTQTEVQQFIDESTSWMEKSTCVQRYAWHDAKVGTSALLLNGQLTESGKAFAKIP